MRIYLGSELVDDYPELLQRAEDSGSLNPSDAPWLSLVIGATQGDEPHLALMKCSVLQ